MLLIVKKGKEKMSKTRKRDVKHERKTKKKHIKNKLKEKETLEMLNAYQ